jgi:hypothetical protein
MVSPSNGLNVGTEVRWNVWNDWNHWNEWNGLGSESLNG